MSWSFNASGEPAKVAEVAKQQLDSIAENYSANNPTEAKMVENARDLILYELAQHNTPVSVQANGSRWTGSTTLPDGTSSEDRNISLSIQRIPGFLL